MTKRIIILGAIVLLVVLAWSGAWLYFSGMIRQQVEALAFSDGETSPRLTCGTLETGGFPFRFDLSCKDAVLVSGDMLAEAPDVRASVMVYRPNHALLWATGPLELSDAFTGQHSAVDWTKIEASVHIESWRINRVSVVADGLDWTDRLFETLIAKASHAELHLLDMPEALDATRHLASLAVYGRLDDAEMQGFAITGAKAELQAEISGLPDDIRNWGVEPILPAWQRNGGALKLVSLTASDDKASLDASGQLALDAQGFPTGNIDITSTGVAERIGPMIEEPWRTLVLGVPGQDGSHKNQINFHNGAISSGLVPIATVPPLF